MTRNSSPPSRPTTSSARHCWRRMRATWIRSRSPAAWPMVSFTDLEAVEIEQQHAGVELVAEAAGDLGREPLLQRPPVVEAGQLVGGRGAVELLHQLRVLERDRGGEGERAGQLQLGAAVQLVADAGAEHQHRHPLGARVERHHQLGAGARPARRRRRRPRRSRRSRRGGPGRGRLCRWGRGGDDR